MEENRITDKNIVKIIGLFPHKPKPAIKKVENLPKDVRMFVLTLLRMQAQQSGIFKRLAKQLGYGQEMSEELLIKLLNYGVLKILTKGRGEAFRIGVWNGYKYV